MSEGTQEVEIVVEGVITRLMPCPQHAARATGYALLASGHELEQDQSVPEGDRVIQNPNGFHHDCPECAGTPTTDEALERTVTRHVL